jgi:Omp85 superfamily domain
MTAVALVVAAVPSVMSAQTSRAEEIASLQAEKAARLAPEGPDAGERLVTRVMSSPLLTGSGGVYPWFGSVYTGTGFGVGIGYLRRLPRSGGLSTVAAAAVSGSTLFDITWDIPAITASEALRPRLSARRVDAKEVGFYGIGAASSKDTRTGFDYQPTSVEAALDARVRGWLRLSGSYGYLGMSTGVHGGGAPATVLPGLGETIDYGIASASAAFDWRTSRAYSTRGGLLRATWSRYDSNGGAAFSFDRVEYEAVQLVPLLQEEYVLAFRAMVTEARPEPGHEVPFVFLPSVGGGDTVRGLVNRRLHDRSRAVIAAEYRWRPSRFLDMALFVDSGTVAARMADLDWNRFTTGWGIGARLHGPAFTALRVDVARSREGLVVVLGGSQPF